jgi:hypothetical protein
MEWQPIETAPKDGRRLLLVDARDGQVCWGEWIDGEWRDMGDIGCNGRWSYEPTHWAPTPPPPVQP